MSLSLGKTLKEAREHIPLTLRQVEESTQISNAYLSQLENDKIKKPSANVLYKLANLYGIELNTLLSAAGIIQKATTNKKSIDTEWINRIAFYADRLSEEQRKEVLQYIKFINFKNKDV